MVKYWAAMGDLRVGERWVDLVGDGSVEWADLQGLIVIRCGNCRRERRPVWPIVALWARYPDSTALLVKVPERHRRRRPRYAWQRRRRQEDLYHLTTSGEIPACPQGCPVGYVEGDAIWFRLDEWLDRGWDELYS